MLTDRQSFSISVIRSISVLLIVLCHILQGNNNLLAWWLNVGVQIFLFMSGFLFGAKDISNYGVWYKKRFIKILIPYYLYIIVAIPIIIVYGSAISLKQIIFYVLNLQGIAGNINGLGHLWYITTISICYFITPIIFKYNISNRGNKECKFYSYFIIQCVVLQVVFWKIAPSFAPLIATYMFGYYLAGRYKYNIPRYIMNLLEIITAILVLMKVYFQYYYSGDVTIIIILIRYSFPWIHALLGSTIFIVLFNTISKVNDLKNKRFFVRTIGAIDKYSYEIYITHHIYILGVFSLLNLTKYNILNILIISMLTIAGSVKNFV